MKKIYYFISFFICLCLSTLSFADNNYYDDFKLLPVLHEGRIKPLDSYARVILKTLAKQESVNNQSAHQWLVDLLLNPSQDYDNKVFYIANLEIRELLNLELRKQPFYSFKELLPGVKHNIDLLTKLQANQAQSTLSRDDKQVLDLYNNILLYFDISRSLSLLMPVFNTAQLEQSLNIKINGPEFVSYYQVLPYKNIIANKVARLSKSPKNLDHLDNQQILTLANLFKNTEADKINTGLKLIPIDSILNTESNNWLAPWEIISSDLGTPNTARYMRLLQQIVYQQNLAQNAPQLKLLAIDLAADSAKNLSPRQLSYKLHAEYYYNSFKLFNKSINLYFISLILSLIYLYQSHKPNKFKHLKLISRFAFCIFSLGFLCNLLGLVLRIFILGRPPVANLYESILFVSLITALFSWMIHLLRQDNVGILIGSLICSVLLFIANSYDVAGDSLGVIIAVLNNNFWLGTHVVSITAGYGSCLILSALAHLYLITGLSYTINSTFKQRLSKYILAFGLLSLFLTLLGTILGGIWADQSWGRFWGWDPKENGALLICLWLIALLHGRISKQLSEIMFAGFAALTSVTVALAWFGVNLLSTGLHSYGFTENIALNLILFVTFELLLITTLVYLNKRITHYET